MQISDIIFLASDDCIPEGNEPSTILKISWKSKPDMVIPLLIFVKRPIMFNFEA